MDTHYKVGVVSGKFRLLHKGHKEVMIRATLENIDKLVIVIHDNNDIHRYSSISELRIAIGQILSEIDFDYEIIICNESFDSIEGWETFVINKIGHDDILMFNSKEDYDNILLDNKFIECKNLRTISASTIETNPYNIDYYEQIAQEFMPYLNKKIVLSGVESSGKTQLSIKLSKTFNTLYSPEYGKNYAKIFLGNDDDSFTPKDFVFIAQNQISQDRELNKMARRTLIVDTDPFVTLRFLKTYYEEYQKRGIVTEEFEKDYNDAYKMLEIICGTYRCDKIFLLPPNSTYVLDHNRQKDQTQQMREERFKELLELYDRFDQKYTIVQGATYKEKFEFIEKEIEKMMDIY